MTALSFHSFVFLPHCNASTRHITMPETSAVPTRSNRAACRRMSRGERFVGLAPKGGDDLSKRITAMTETPPIGRLMKKHQCYWSRCELWTRTGVERQRETYPSDLWSMSARKVGQRSRNEWRDYNELTWSINAPPMSGAMIDESPNMAPNMPNNLRRVTWATVMDP